MVSRSTPCGRMEFLPISRNVDPVRRVDTRSRYRCVSRGGDRRPCERQSTAGVGLPPYDSWVDELSLLAAARAGDGAAFGDLVAPHVPALRVHCYRMLGSYHDAEDAMQDVLVRAGGSWTATSSRLRRGTGCTGSRPPPR